MLILVDLFLDPVLGSFPDGLGQLDASQLVSSSSSSARGSHPGDCHTGLTVIIQYQLTSLINILKFSIWVLRGVLFFPPYPSPAFGSCFQDLIKAYRHGLSSHPLSEFLLPTLTWCPPNELCGVLEVLPEHLYGNLSPELLYPGTLFRKLARKCCRSCHLRCCPCRYW